MIWCVDDDSTIRDIEVYTLEQTGFKARGFADGISMLEALKAELLRPEYQSSYSKLTEIQGQIDAMEEEIMADMEVWEELSSQLEELLAEENALK